MQVRVVTEKNDVILEHSQEGNGHEQIFSRRVASNTKAGQCHFQIIDTGSCLLWIGEFIIAESFNIHINQTNESLQMLIAWPQQPGDNFASVFEKPLLLFHIACSIKVNGSSKLSCDAGKGQLLLFSYRKGFSQQHGFPDFQTPFSNGYQLPPFRMDSHKASILQHILYYPIPFDLRQN